ncbi:MAG TPA: hypothetical protein VMW10_04075 [Alphaproteobacteria bacterium]|nr:hypothetical protein [Alphaproteobacteria bacterium]
MEIRYNERNTQTRTYKHMLFVLTTCVSSCVFFNEAYCMECNGGCDEGSLTTERRGVKRKIIEKSNSNTGRTKNTARKSPHEDLSSDSEKESVSSSSDNESDSEVDTQESPMKKMKYSKKPPVEEKRNEAVGEKESQEKESPNKNTTLEDEIRSQIEEDGIDFTESPHGGDKILSVMVKEKYDYTRVNCLDLSKTNLSNKGLKKFSRIALPELRELILDDNPIGSSLWVTPSWWSTNHLTDFIQVKFPQLTNLSLDNAEICAGDLSILGGAEWPLERLSLIGNKIGDAGAIALAESNLSKLQSLHLEGNEIGDVGAIALAGAKWLQKYDLKDGDDIESIRFQAGIYPTVNRRLPNKRWVKVAKYTWNLSQNNISDAGLNALSEVNKTSKYPWEIQPLSTPKPHRTKRTAFIRTLKTKEAESIIEKNVKQEPDKKGKGKEKDEGEGKCTVGIGRGGKGLGYEDRVKTLKAKKGGKGLN